METEFKTKLRQNLVQVFKEKKLEDNVQPCFVRQTEICTQIHSFDQAYALTSLIQCPIRLRKVDRETDIQSLVSNLSVAASEDEDYESLLSVQKANFWLAYKSLSTEKAENLKLGIELAKRVQQLIVEQGISFVEKSEVKPYRSFRYIIMNKNNTRDQRFFSHPLSL